MNGRAFDRNKKIKRIIFVSVALILVVAMLLVIRKWEKKRSLFDGEAHDWKPNDVFEYNGQQYELRQDVETILIMGLDKFGETIDYTSYNNDQQADFLMLLVVDHGARSCSAIHLNRDTIAEITVLGVGGKKVGTVKQPLALAHTYGSGGNDSCRNTVEAVSKLMYNLPIDHYMSLTMDAVQILNDLVGGVTVTVLDDFSGVDDSLKQGETVTLLGETALTYVRSRYGVGDSGNVSRMARQQQYMTEFYNQTRRYIKEHEEFSSDAMLKIAEYMVSDCSVTHMDKLSNDILEYQTCDFYTIDGELIVGDEYMEFYLDDNAVKDILVKLFYKVKD